MTVGGGGAVAVGQGGAQSLGVLVPKLVPGEHLLVEPTGGDEVSDGVQGPA